MTTSSTHSAQNIAIIMAAGHGSRMRNTCPKQFLKINGKMLMEYSIETFQKHPLIDSIVVVLPSSSPQELTDTLKDKYLKIKALVIGGNERFQSSWAAIQLFEKYPFYNLLLHDAARPLVTPAIISANINALATSSGVITAQPVTDTILQVDSNKLLTQVPDRANLYYAQTPQSFKAGTIYHAFQKLFTQHDFIPTDESGVMSHYFPQMPIQIVPGDPDNFKITYPTDIEHMKQLLLSRS